MSTKKKKIIDKKIENEKDFDDKGRGRSIFGTLTAPKDNPFYGNREEFMTILNYLKGSSKQYELSVISCESHEDESMHFHFLVRYTNAVRDNLIKKMRKYFDLLKGSVNNRIVFNDDNWLCTIGYITKHQDPEYEEKLDFMFDGNITELQIKQGYQTYKTAKKNKEVEEKMCVKISKKTYEEQKIFDRVSVYMKLKDYVINEFTREIWCSKTNKVVSVREFIKCLNRDIEFLSCGTTGKDLIENAISDSTSYFLPVWCPEAHITKFTDYYYDSDKGERFSLDHPDYINSVPVRIWNRPIPWDSQPSEFLKIVEKHKWDKELLRKHYGSLFKTKVRREPNIGFYGPTNTGKSSLSGPYEEVYSGIIKKMANDGRFSYSTVASTSKVILNEYNPFIGDESHIADNLKFFEGESFMGPLKHSNKNVEIVPKNILTVTNIEPPFDTQDSMLHALLSRFIFFAATYVYDDSEIDRNMIQQVRDEAAEVLVWSTRK